jgi:hypothetical protein
VPGVRRRGGSRRLGRPAPVGTTGPLPTLTREPTDPGQREQGIRLF